MKETLAVAIDVGVLAADTGVKRFYFCFNQIALTNISQQGQ